MPVSAEQLQELIANITKWPVCQHPKCGLPIPYVKNKYRGSAARWMRRKYCSRKCCGEITSKVCAEKNRKRVKILFKTCQRCKKKFPRPKGITPSAWYVRKRCPKCWHKIRLFTGQAGVMRGSAFGKPIKPGFYPFTMIRERSGVFAEKVERQRPYPNCMETYLKSHRDEKINRIIEEMNYV